MGLAMFWKGEDCWQVRRERIRGIILEEWLAGFGERSKMQLEARVLDKRIVAALHNYSTVPVITVPQSAPENHSLECISFILLHVLRLLSI